MTDQARAAGGADPVAVAAAALCRPGLVVLAGPPGIGRSTALDRLGAKFRGQVFAGGSLAMLGAVPALPLTRAVRVRLPTHDPALLAEAVRSRVRHGVLLLDDIQWADPLTVATLPAIAAHCRVAVTLRTPHRLPSTAERTWRAAATAWLTIGPLPTEAAAALVMRLAPGTDPATVADLVRRAGAVPAALTVLGRQQARAAARRGIRTGPTAVPTTGHTDGGDTGDTDRVAYAIATALADLTRPARTALAALGLLGHPATPELLGDGVTELADAGLIDLTAGLAAPTSPYTAEIAAGLLATAERQALHRRLADLVPPGESARHLAAAGDHHRAYDVAVDAARAATASGEQAELLRLACTVPGVVADPRIRIAAARAALTTGRAGICLRLLDPATHADTVGDTAPQSFRTTASLLRADALLQRHDAAGAAAAVAPIGDETDPAVRSERDRIRLLTTLATRPAHARHHLEPILARHGDPPTHPGLRVAVAAVRAADRKPGWEHGLASATAAAAADGDLLAARWSAWLLVDALTGDGRLAEAASAAAFAAQACAADLAYGWQTRFLAAGLWCDAVRGEDLDTVVRRGGDLTDRTLPAVARGYAGAALSLAQADGGLLGPARERLQWTDSAGSDGHRAPPAAVLDWVAREAAWLDGQPELALHRGPGAEAPGAEASGAAPLITGLRMITAWWAAHDMPGRAADSSGASGSDGQWRLLPEAARTTIDALTGATAGAGPDGAEAGAPAGGLADAAAAWRGIALREQVRCLLAQGLLAADGNAAVPVLLTAERLAEQAGLVVLLGRTRRALRRHAVRRDSRGPRTGDALTDRERDVLRLVAAGEPTRRIAGQLGVSRETVETHIRAGMRKLGARTRTEAAALAIETLS